MIKKMKKKKVIRQTAKSGKENSDKKKRKFPKLA